MVELLDDDVPAPAGGDGSEYSNPVLEVQLREVAELSIGKEPPSEDEQLEEWRWIRDQDEAGTLDPEWKFGGQHVAVYQKQIVGTDADEFRLRIRLAKELGVHPNRPVLSYRDYDG